MYLAAAFLLLLSWFLPMFALPWTGWHKEVLVFVAAALAFGALLWQTWSSRQLVLPRATGWFFGLVAVLVWQGLNGTASDQGDALVMGGYLLVAVMVVAVGFGQQDPGKAATGLGLLLLVAAVASTLLALVQTLDVWDLGEWESLIIRPPSLRRPGANLGQPNHLAIMLLFALASLGYLRTLGRVSGAMAAFLALVLLIGLVLTESRTGILGLALLSAWWWWWQRPSGRARLALAALLVCFLVLVWLWPQWHQALQLGTAAGGTAQYNSNPVGRLVVWPQLWQAVLLKPWGGWGLRKVSEAHNAVLDAYVVGEPYTYAHNVVLDLAIGIGLPLTLLFVAAVLVWLGRRLRAAREPVSWYGMAMVLVLGLHSQLEFPYAYAYLLFPVLFLVGMLEARLAPARVFHLPIMAAAAIYALLMATLAWSAWEYVQVEEDLRVARFEALKVGKTPTDYERPQIRLLKQLDTMLAASRIQPAPGMSAQELELARQAAMRFPWTALQNRYALALALNGQQDEAVRQLKVMRAMHGEKTYAGIKANWITLAEEKYPQLQALPLP